MNYLQYINMLHLWGAFCTVKCDLKIIGKEMFFNYLRKFFVENLKLKKSLNVIKINSFSFIINAKISEIFKKISV